MKEVVGVMWIVEAFWAFVGDTWVKSVEVGKIRGSNRSVVERGMNRPFDSVRVQLGRSAGFSVSILGMGAVSM